MTRDEIMEQYGVNQHGFIKSSSKFGGEMLYAPYFYDATLNGCAEELAYLEDGCGKNACLVEIDDNDRTMFPEITASDTYAFVCENDQGFVSVSLVDNAGADRLRAEYEPDDDDEDEENDDDE